MDRNIRHIKLKGSHNMRDLGGYKSIDGRRVKWGILYRSDDLYSLTKEDIKIVNSLGIKSIVDFRTASELSKRPDKIIEGTTVYHFDTKAESAALASGSIQTDKEKVEKLVNYAEKYGARYFESKKNEMRYEMRRLVTQEPAISCYRKMFDILLDKENVPLLEHCRGGKDRAGVGAMLILASLGVAREDILKDYMLTKNYSATRNKNRMADYEKFTDNKIVLDYLYSLMDTREEYITEALDIVFNGVNGIQGYFETLGLDFEACKKLRNMYLE